jgi:conjugal transfer/type IV secretion protein DotA/TraY
MRIIISLLILFLPSLVAADIFSPPPTDKSVDFLGYIFGPNIGSVYLGGAANPALMHMFERFNSVIITIGTMIVSYVGVISTINTAQEGQVMGRKWSSVWIPMRSVLGMLVLVPAPGSGYSVIQTAVMWCIMQGIGAADNVWNGVLNDLSNGLSATQAIARPKANTHAALVYDGLEMIGADLADDMLRTAVCMQTIRKIYDGSAIQPHGGFRTPDQSNIRDLGAHLVMYETVHNNQQSSAEFAEHSGTLRFGVQNHPEFSAICGQYNVAGLAKRTDWGSHARVSQDEMHSKAREIYQHKITALEFMYSNYLAIASNIVDEAVFPRDDNQRLTASPEQELFPSGFRNEAIISYRETLKYMVRPQQIDNIQSIVHEGIANGWLAAGSFYFTLNQTHDVDFFHDIMSAPKTELIPKCDLANACSIYTPDPANLLSEPLRNFLQYGPEISYMATRLWDSKIYLENDFTTISDRLSLMPKNAPNATPLQKMQNNMLDLLQEMMSEQDIDPLIAQGKFGASIMVLSERSWLSAQSELHTTLNRAEEGYTPITAELKRKISNLSYKGTISVAIYSVVWIVGATLAIYVPLVPYLIFTIGVVGWLMLVIEAVVAAPILAVGFMLPSGDELGKMVQGLLLLLNILLRPVLMLFGFILATRLYQAVVKLVNFGMLTNLNLINTYDSMFAWVAVLTLYATFVIALSNKCFSLIYGLPDKILRWMGGTPEHTDTSQEMHHAKSTMLKGADTVNKISTGIPERNLSSLQSRAKQLFPPDAVRNG